MKSALNTPLLASSSPRYLGPPALFMAHLALAVVYKTCIIGLGTVLSGIGTYSTTELEEKKEATGSNQRPLLHTQEKLSVSICFEQTSMAVRQSYYCDTALGQAGAPG